MTYLQFHLFLILPPLLVLAATLGGSVRRIGKSAGFIPLLSLIAFLYTTPWDNFLVWRGVWDYGPERVLGTIGFVPIEEYAFFLLQPMLTGAWFYHVLARARPGKPVTDRSRWGGIIAYGGATAVGAALLPTQSGHYAGLILAWAGPVLLAQWVLAWRQIWSRRAAFLIGVAVPTVYLWICDGIAISQGIWRISERFTLGPSLFGLPFEEALFFLVTNILVVQGLLLFLHPPPLDFRRRAPAAEAGTSA